MTTTNTIIDKAVEEAKNLGKEVRQSLLGNVNGNDFVAIDQTYPTMIETDATPATRRVNREKHQEYLDRVSKMILTHSLFLGLGIEPPTGHALKKELAAELATECNATFTKQASAEHGEIYSTTVELEDAQYRFLETDLWLAYLRAIHFAVTRNDPDLTEIINRKLAAENGLNDAEWLDAAYKADEAKKAS
ncbi:hypothetical protein 2050HW_00112 [Serratia phage vB_SmaM_ 2050HW]|uniref:Uncharacterized protein n=1 Tax=Serratia phage vB_SmaM_ 2050HW TaxID=2024252 RepID=A0A289YVB9_9CAUD|nr:hypothetical protein HWB23_gp112 [Serratia phage vB_SmaM_ 2050HW]ATA65447.1 hypothetical protein 2050HW_00112 [Serratia phage vB_SmaM_ 2050HW]UGO54074.1 hypothetical protein HAYMO_92 [Serratia phage vB_SmaM_Haymo]UQT03583.1 hypothetical protein KODAMA_01160 [Serratia phage vB_SmaM-Kodama]URG14286.1 hypothetical protein [Pectobacterium phage vB_ParM-25]